MVLDFSAIQSLLSLQLVQLNHVSEVILDGLHHLLSLLFVHPFSQFHKLPHVIDNKRVFVSATLLFLLFYLCLMNLVHCLALLRNVIFLLPSQIFLSSL